MAIETVNVAFISLMTFSDGLRLQDTTFTIFSSDSPKLKISSLSAFIMNGLNCPVERLEKIC